MPYNCVIRLPSADQAVCYAGLCAGSIHCDAAHQARQRACKRLSLKCKIISRQLAPWQGKGSSDCVIEVTVALSSTWRRAPGRASASKAAYALVVASRARLRRTAGASSRLTSMSACTVQKLTCAAGRTFPACQASHMPCYARPTFRPCPIADSLHAPGLLCAAAVLHKIQFEQGFIK